MVYYTFNDESVSHEQRQLLFRATKKVLDAWGFEPRVYDSNDPKPLWLIGNKDPYIEINGPHGWLTIRKLTNMKQEDAAVPRKEWMRRSQEKGPLPARP